MSEVMNISARMNDLLHKLYQLVLFVDISENKASVLQNECNTQDTGKIYDYDAYLQKSVEYLSEEDQKRVQKEFSSEVLLKKYYYGQEMFCLDFEYKLHKQKNCITITAMLEAKADGKVYAYILVRENSHDYLLRNVINIYLSHNCDYFLLIDAKNDSYKVFSQNDSGTPLPPAISHNYSLEIVKYARAYVVPEDQDMVIEEMKLDRVIDQLDKHGVHTFYAGVTDPIRGYTRKYLEYRYYNKELKLIILSRTDVTPVYLERKKYMHQLEKALKRAQTDPLTKLYNYQGIVEHISDYLNSPKRTNLSALLFLDLDNFKTVNDNFGHQAGDKFLCNVARILRAVAHKNNFVGRIGGDEFIIFLKNIANEQTAIDCAKKICEEINKLVYEQAYDNVSCSIGIAISPKDGKTYKQLVAVADKLVYKSKHLGKNRYSI